MTHLENAWPSYPGNHSLVWISGMNAQAVGVNEARTLERSILTVLENVPRKNKNISIIDQSFSCSSCIKNLNVCKAMHEPWANDLVAQAKCLLMRQCHRTRRFWAVPVVL